MVLSESQLDLAFKRLKGPVSQKLTDWVWANTRRARAEGVEKLEDFAEDKYQQRRKFITYFFRNSQKHLQNATGDTLGHAVKIFSGTADAIENDDRGRLTKVVSSLSEEELKDAAGLAIQMTAGLDASGKKPELYKFEVLFVLETIGPPAATGENSPALSCVTIPITVDSMIPCGFYSIARWRRPMNSTHCWHPARSEGS